jgi:hypothetical protein
VLQAADERLLMMPRSLLDLSTPLPGGGGYFFPGVEATRTFNAPAVNFGLGSYGLPVPRVSGGVSVPVGDDGGEANVSGAYQAIPYGSPMWSLLLGYRGRF